MGNVPLVEELLEWPEMTDEAGRMGVGIFPSDVLSE